MLTITMPTHVGDLIGLTWIEEHDDLARDDYPDDQGGDDLPKNGD